LTNAHKYSATDKPIHLRAWHDRKAVHIEVVDHGIGIARQEHHRVFEKFYRSDDRLSRSIEGSGLGLSIVKHVVIAHKGKVALRSAVGQGSAFTLTFPLQPDLAPAATEASTPDAPPAPATIADGPKGS
jgi:two-component system phosphate regulon sensor histidine kinase PhoR